MWYANGHRQPTRFVTQMGATPATWTVRDYTLQDMMQCGSMGFLDNINDRCRVDAAVTPLFYIYCAGPTHRSTSPCSTLVDGLYDKGKTKTELRALAVSLNTLLARAKWFPTSVSSWA
jgi:hypothetical protein